MTLKKLISNDNPSLTMAIRNDTDIRYLPIIGWHFDLGLATPVTMEDIDDYSFFAVFDSVTNDWWVDNGGIRGNGEESLVDTFDLYKQLRKNEPDELPL
jgi:hypothetical protein